MVKLLGFEKQHHDFEKEVNSPGLHLHRFIDNHIDLHHDFTFTKKNMWAYP